MPEETTNKPAQRTERVGKYEILGHIATGGMGVVYKARDVDLDRFVALKILPPDLAKQKATLIRFQREAKAAALLRHENIVTIFDVGEVNGMHYIALEFIEGTDLQEYIDRKCKIDPDDARQIMIQAARALAHAHERGIVHRDIKPSNFLLMQRDSGLLVKLTDFGLAIRYENDADFRITRAKTTVGTVDYMSPEQALDSRSVDIRSDIYSLGCTSFHMLAGVAPFAKGTLPERIVHHMRTPAPDLCKQNKGVPDYLGVIIGRMLAKKPDDRYQTPGELLKDLENPKDVVAPERPNGVRARVEKDKARKARSEPTSLIEKEDREESIEEPRQVKVVTKKRISASAKTEHADDWVESASQDDGSRRKGVKKKDDASSLWMYATGGTVALLVMILVAVIIANSRGQPKKEPEKRPDLPPVVLRPVPKPDEPKIDTSPEKMTVVAPALPVMDTDPELVDARKLRAEFAGPFTEFPSTPPKAETLRVSRLTENGPASFRTLEAAVGAAKADQWTIIEIHDNGPLYLSGLAPLAQRSIVLRGAAGYRPLLVWDGPRKTIESKTAPAFATVRKGALILDRLDFVMQRLDVPAAVVFDVPNSDFCARNCTFSLAGKAAASIALVRRTEDAGSARTMTWLQRSYVRGADMTLLDQNGASTDIMIEESLVAGYEHPVLKIRGRDQDEISLRSIRSTLVCGQMFLRWQALEGNAGSPAIRAHVLDTIISRDDATMPIGDMVHLAGGAEPSNIRWRTHTSVFGGWKKLVASSAKVILGQDVAGWNRQFVGNDEIRAVPEPWPGDPPPDLEEQPAGAFLPAATHVAFAAHSGPGAVGSVVGWLPGAPDRWQERVFEQASAPHIPAPNLVPPKIDPDDGTYFTGGPFDCSKGDLGAELAKTLQTRKPASRVVVYLTGLGACKSSPLNFKGIDHVILYADAFNPLNQWSLEIHAPSPTASPPAISMTGGHLEIVGMNLRLNPNTLVPSLISVRDGSLTLTRCQLQGPMFRPADTFQSLIVMKNAHLPESVLLVQDSKLLSSKSVAHIQEDVQIRARNNVIASLSDAIILEPSQSSGSLNHVLDHNTFAVRHNTFVLRHGPDVEPGGQTLVHANSNAFLAPFADSGEKRALVRGSDTWLGRGLWVWQGRHNVYDSRLHAYLSAIDQRVVSKQTLQDWQRAWGRTREASSLAHDFGATVKTINADTPTGANNVLAQFDRLYLPTTLRGDPEQAPPGAELLKLGIPKKK